MEKESRNWASIFDDFVTNPPTTSAFRLYLLSFLIWNHSAILYIIFHNQSMWDKLKNIYEFVPILHNWFSFYFGPLIPLGVIYLIAFYPLPILKTNNEEKSLYDFLFHKHQINLKKRSTALIETLEVKEEILDKEIDIENKKEELNEVAESNERKQWLVEYESFKLRSAIYQDFIKFARLLNTRKNITFYESSNEWISADFTFKIQTAILNVIRDEENLVVMDRQSYNNSHYYMSLTRKGRFFLEQSRFSRGD